MVKIQFKKYELENRNQNDYIISVEEGEREGEEIQQHQHKHHRQHVKLVKTLFFSFVYMQFRKCAFEIY